MHPFAAIDRAMLKIIAVCDELEQAKFTPSEPYLRDKVIKAAFNLRKAFQVSEKEINDDYDQCGFYSDVDAR